MFPAPVYVECGKKSVATAARQNHCAQKRDERCDQTAALTKLLIHLTPDSALQTAVVPEVIFRSESSSVGYRLHNTPASRHKPIESQSARARRAHHPASENRRLAGTQSNPP